MNLTITVDDEVLRRARIRALSQGTSVNALLREFLESYAGSNVETDARNSLAEMARESTASSGPGGRTWTRNEVYADRLDESFRKEAESVVSLNEKASEPGSMTEQRIEELKEFMRQ